MHVGFGKDQRTGSLQPLHHGAGRSRHRRQRRLGARLHGRTFQLEQVLHADPGAQQRPLRGTVRLPSDPVGQRVPTINVSLVDLSFIAARDTTVEEVNKILKPLDWLIQAGKGLWIKFHFISTYY